MMRGKRNLSLLCKFLEVNSRRRPCTRLSFLQRCELWPISWSLTFIRWRIWQPCRAKDRLPTWSLYSQWDWYLWSHLLSLRQVHKEEKVKANSTIPKLCHVSNIKGKGEDSKWSSDHAKGRAYQWANYYSK